MADCKQLDPLLTPYVDGELDAASRDRVNAHLRACPPCHTRMVAERSVRALLRDRRDVLRPPAPPTLHARCATAAARRRTATAPSWPRRLAPLAVAAGLVLFSGVSIYEATPRSARLLAAELTADHVKCFTLNSLIGPNGGPQAVEAVLASRFGWRARLPQRPEQIGLELIGARPCLYGQGRIAHIMYRHHGHPVSVFMLPDTVRPDQFVEVMGHEAVIWTEHGRTFVLLASEPRPQVERMASFVEASLR